MKPYVKVALVFVTFLAIGGILSALYLFNMKHKDMLKTKPDFIISANALVKAFEDDEKTASARYINKVIEVSGKIASVKPGENNTTSITIVTGSDLSSVICTFPSIKDNPEFAKGDEITLRGECSGFLMDVLLNNCAVIEKQK